MAAKRSAKKQLTQDNWEEEDAKEEAGTFAKANEETIVKRQIRKAIRRSHIPITENGNETGKSLFGSINLTSKLFSNNDNMLQTNGTSSTSIIQQNGVDGDTSNSFLTKNDQSFKITPFIINGQKNSNKSDSPPVKDFFKETTSEKSHCSEYFKQLGALNKGVSDWIRQHVDKNPYCILTPIFKDYENHLKSIEELSPESSPEILKSYNTSTTVIDKMKKTSPTITGKPFSGFTFGNDTKSFNVAASSLVSNLKKSDSIVDSHDDEYVPPVPEEVNIQEEGSVYSVKCKLFFKIKDSYKEKGVGTLFLKTVKEKTQLIVRTDTNLGLILLNIILTKTIPCNRLGKNNVAMLCVPYPPLDTEDVEPHTPISILIRVKTEDIANELLSKINEYKI